ncbi:hypothetical protein [Brevibacterium linens]|uniref:hypothetical protein n=1 Tax=Brevibacterium linens TaxID=1703 RepID=UPI003BF46BC1
MNSGTENESEAAAGVDSEVEVDGEAEASSRTDERRIIGDAIARGGQVTLWIAAPVGLLLIASGLWWAGLLIIFVTNLDLTRVAARRYLRAHGIKLKIPSAQDAEVTTLSGLLTGVGLIAAICALAIAQYQLGHPILSWSWRAFTDGIDLVALVPLVGLGLFITIRWLFHWWKSAEANGDHVTR